MVASLLGGGFNEVLNNLLILGCELIVHIGKVKRLAAWMLFVRIGDIGPPLVP